MSKVRVYELARELQIGSKDLLLQMKALDIVVVSHQSTLTPAQVDAIKAFYRRKAEPVAPAKPRVLIRRRKKTEPVEPPAEQVATSEPIPEVEETKSAEVSSLPEVVEKEPKPTPQSEEEKPAPPKEEKEKEVAGRIASKEEKARDDESPSYGKVKGAAKGTVKTRRSTTARTREILRTIEEDSDSSVDDYAATNRPVKTVYTPAGVARKRDLKRKKNLKKTPLTTSKASHRIIKMEKEISVSALARQLSVKAVEVIQKLATVDIEATADTTLDFDTVMLVAAEYDYEVQSKVKTLQDIIASPAAKDAELCERPPVVTVMGHVDHGKTSILDTIRKTNVAVGEAGGITQHIGAYTAEVRDKSITFLDTPGHEAFTSMRVRGAKVTDIVILVVAADDGVMPQTIESISHAQEANVPMIVALNKIDKPNKNLDRIFSELSERGVQVEKWGGEVQCVEVSAKENIGIGELLEAILLQAEVMELKSPRGVPPSGTVIEAHLDKHRGAVATVLVQAGTLQRGDFIATSSGYAKVRAMTDHRGKTLSAAAGVSAPVQVLGFAHVPSVGDRFDGTQREKTAKEISDWYQDNAGQKQVDAGNKTLDDLLHKAAKTESPTLSLIIKADTQGSAEAIAGALLNIKSERVENKIMHQGVGAVVESDITLASATKSIIVAFNVRAHRDMEELAHRRGVTIRYFTIIYEIIDAVKTIMAGLLPPDINEVVIGQADVRRPISIPRIGVIAGSSVTSGRITRGAHLRLLRDAVVIYSGKVGSLKRLKEDVKEVSIGYECGIGIEGYQDIREGDVIEAYMREESVPDL